MGCQMNEYDSDHLGRILEDSGYLPTGDPEKADFVLLNTCSVREKAEQKAVSRLGRLATLKSKNLGSYWLWRVAWRNKGAWIFLSAFPV